MTDVSPTQKAKEAIDPRCKEEKKRRNSDPIQKDNEWKRQFKREEIDKTDFSNSFVEQPFWLKGEIYEVYHEGGKVKSIVTILSIWNTMIGSSTVTMPSCVKNAGIIPTVLFNMIFCSICFYTCRVVVKTGGKDNDYADTVSRYFGKKFGFIGRCVQILFNLSINVGATFVYFVIINQNLYPCLAILINAIFNTTFGPDDLERKLSTFSIFYCGVIISLLVFPLLIMKNMTILIKLNSFGIYFVSVLLIFVMSTGIYSLATTSFDFEYIKNIGQEGVRHLYLFGESPAVLAGTLSLGYFSHSFVLPLMKNNEKQENNKRDLFLGYLLVMLTYIIVGISGYIGFSGSYFTKPTFEDNWFRFFKPEIYWVIILRLINVIQLLSIFPILFYIVRIQFFGTFWHNNYPGKIHVLCFSSSLVVLCWFILYFLADKLGVMLSFIGAFTGLFLIYIIPCVVNIVYYKRKHPKNLKELQAANNTNDLSERLYPQTDVEDDSNSEKKKKQNEIKSSNDDVDKDIDDYGISEKPPNKIKDIFFYISQGLLVVFGLFTLIIQFIPGLNMFGVKLRDQ